MKRKKALNQEMNMGGLVLEMAGTFFNEFFCRRDYEWWYVVQPGDVVVDLGACVGMMSADSLDKGASKVYMVEANRELLKTAIENVSEYCMNEPDPKVYPINAIIGSSDSEGCYITKRAPLPADDDLDRISFKELITQYGITKIDYLKCDIEGNEYDVFNKNTLEYCFNNVKHMAIEVHVKATPDGPDKFIQFRDEFIKPFAESSQHNVRSMEEDDFINSLWDDEAVRNLPIERSYFMLYITRVEQ
jgi:FkbM family methyltransferase